MAVARAVRAALALAMASAAGSAAAQVAARPVAIYPFSRSDGAAAEDAQGLLESAVQRAVNRSEDVVLAEPAVVRPACGPAQTAPAPCLQKLAGSGLVLRAILHRSERSSAIAVEAVDGALQRTVGPVTVGIDTFIQNPEPLARALLMLFDDVRAANRKAAGASAIPRPQLVAPPLVATTAPRPDPSRAEPAKAPPDLRAPEPKAPPAASVAREAPRRPWLRAAAPWVAGTGLALLAGAAVVAVKNQELSQELDKKFQEGTLSPADAAKYDQVEQYNALAIGLAAAGGALTLTSAFLFTVAPAPGGGSVAAVGHF
jgi:hypothetical protein